MPASNPSAPFARHKYLNLETYRKSGLPVATPVWFAESTGTFYIYSLADAGKVKRIRNKYGWMKRIGDAFSKLMHRRRVAIAVEIV